MAYNQHAEYRPPPRNYYNQGPPQRPPQQAQAYDDGFNGYDQGWDQGYEGDNYGYQNQPQQFDAGYNDGYQQYQPPPQEQYAQYNGGGNGQLYQQDPYTQNGGPRKQPSLRQMHGAPDPRMQQPGRSKTPAAGPHRGRPQETAVRRNSFDGYGGNQYGNGPNGMPPPGSQRGQHLQDSPRGRKPAPRKPLVEPSSPVQMNADNPFPMFPTKKPKPPQSNKIERGMDNMSLTDGRPSMDQGRPPMNSRPSDQSVSSMRSQRSDLGPRPDRRMQQRSPLSQQPYNQSNGYEQGYNQDFAPSGGPVGQRGPPPGPIRQDSSQSVRTQNSRFQQPEFSPPLQGVARSNTMPNEVADNAFQAQFQGSRGPPVDYRDPSPRNFVPPPRPSTSTGTRPDASRSPPAAQAPAYQKPQYKPYNPNAQNDELHLDAPPPSQPAPQAQPPQQDGSYDDFYDDYYGGPQQESPPRGQYGAGRGVPNGYSAAGPNAPPSQGFAPNQPPGAQMPRKVSRNQRGIGAPETDPNRAYNQAAYAGQAMGPGAQRQPFTEEPASYDYGSPQGQESPQYGRPQPQRPGQLRMDTNMTVQSARSDPGPWSATSASPSVRPGGLPSGGPRSARTSPPRSVQASPAEENPDALPQHPVPVRPGLMNKPAPVRQYNNVSNSPAKIVPSPRGSLDRQRPQGPVTHEELNSLRAHVKANPSDHKTALMFAKRLIEAGSTLANEGGRADARTTAKNREKFIFESHKVVKKCVGAGYPEAQFYLADCYGSGSTGLPVDPKEAFTLYLSAAKSGHAQAAYRTAVCCEMGAEDGGGTRRDPIKAVQWYRRAASLGDTAAMYKLGMVLLKGLLGQQRSVGEAVSWLERAAKQADPDNPHALHELGLLYEQPQANSDRVIRDENYARELFMQASNLGYKYSQWRLGQAFEHGQLGCPIDQRQSIGWYSKAAAQEEHQSELSLSGWYLTGAPGILEQSDTEAYLWARKAATAEPPLPKALFAMGYFTEIGIGCPRSLEEAKRWYGRSAAYKFPKAQDRLDELRKGGSKAQKSRERLSRSNQKHNDQDCTVM